MTEAFRKELAAAGYSEAQIVKEATYLERLDWEADYLASEAGLRDEEGRLPDAYDPEAQADLELHDFLHPDGYGR